MPSRWSSRVCFAGIGPGEVVGAATDGRKLVGLSQRRTRRGARLQSAVHLRFDPAATTDLLDLAPAERTAARAELAAGVGAIGAIGATTGAVESAFLEALPA